MTILAIDTSNYPLGVALIEDNKVLGEYITNLKKNHSVRIMPAIQTLMKDCERTPSTVNKNSRRARSRLLYRSSDRRYHSENNGLVVKGTFSWCFSLEVIAAGAGRYFDGYISPLIDARRGQVYTGLV